MQRLAQWATILGALTLTLLTGCAPMQATGQNSPASYRPKLPADITTFEDARKDLALQLSKPSNSQGLLVALHPWPFQPDDTAASDRFFKMNRGIHEIHLLGETQTAHIWVRSIAVLDDRIELPQQAFLFDDLPTLDIAVKSDANDHIDFSKNISVYYFADAKRAADDLFFMQQNMQQYKDGQKAQQALFEAPGQPRTSPAKQRRKSPKSSGKFIIQANALTQERDYKGAIERYKKRPENRSCGLSVGLLQHGPALRRTGKVQAGHREHEEIPAPGTDGKGRPLGTGQDLRMGNEGGSVA